LALEPPRASSPSGTFSYAKTDDSAKENVPKEEDALSNPNSKQEKNESNQEKTIDIEPQQQYFIIIINIYFNNTTVLLWNHLEYVNKTTHQPLPTYLLEYMDKTLKLETKNLIKENLFLS
jgi:hypothetical protein